MTAWSKVTMIDASHFDANEAYAAVERHQLEDYEPYIYRTRDGGKTWQKITSGLPAGVYTQTVKEDPVKRGLLFAGTEIGVYVSFNDGDSWQSLKLNLPPASMRDGAHWQPLQYNLPHTSMRDLLIHDDDLIVATHGRSFWVLDDITALRQIDDSVANSSAFLFKPADAVNMLAGSENGTPLPKDEPFAENPQNGAMIDYYLKSDATGPVTLEILDAAGQSHLLIDTLAIAGLGIVAGSRLEARDQALLQLDSGLQAGQLHGPGRVLEVLHGLDAGDV